MMMEGIWSEFLHGERIFFSGKRLDQACSAFYVAQAASTEFGLHAGNMKFHTQTEG
jgi:hypothetical protein